MARPGTSANSTLLKIMVDPAAPLAVKARCDPNGSRRNSGRFPGSQCGLGPGGLRSGRLTGCFLASDTAGGTSASNRSRQFGNCRMVEYIGQRDVHSEFGA